MDEHPVRDSNAAKGMQSNEHKSVSTIANATKNGINQEEKVRECSESGVAERIRTHSEKHKSKPPASTIYKVE